MPTTNGQTNMYSGYYSSTYASPGTYWFSTFTTPYGTSYGWPGIYGSRQAVWESPMPSEVPTEAPKEDLMELDEEELLSVIEGRKNDTDC